jgi:hypothetical protein
MDERRREHDRVVEGDTQTVGQFVESVDGECDGVASVHYSRART